MDVIPVISTSTLAMVLDQVHDNLDINLSFAATPEEIAETLADSAVTIAEQARDPEVIKAVLNGLIETLMRHFTAMYVLSDDPIRPN